jgi:hypothetical protein
MGCFRGLLILVVIVAIGSVAASISGTNRPQPTAQATAPTLDKSPEMQADRKQLQRN